jgi:CheY-like chemotaxis protein
VKPWQGKSILIVDDSEKSLESLKALYTRLGLTVVGTAENGVEALSGIEELRPDIVSLDIIMPEMDGIECYQNIVERELTVVCVFVSCLAADPIAFEKLKEIIPEKNLGGKPATEASIEDLLDRAFGVKVAEETENPLRGLDLGIAS